MSLDGEPWFIDDSQVYALQSHLTRHDSHQIASAFAHGDFQVEITDRSPTTLETKRYATQKAQTAALIGPEADRVADAPEIAETEGLSPEARAIARKKDQIGKRFNIDPAELTAQHVLDIGDAFSARRNRLLYDNTTTLGLVTHGYWKQ